MINVITSNPLDIKSIHRQNDNFILVHTTKVILPPRSEPGFNFDIYYQDGFDIHTECEPYEDSPGINLNYIPVAMITEALDGIIEEIVDQEEEGENEAAKSGDTIEENMLAVVCNYKWCHQAVRYMRTELRGYKCEIEPLNLFKELHMPSDMKLAEYVKMTMNSNLVYPEDPIQYGYVIYQILDGYMR